MDQDEEKKLISEAICGKDEAFAELFREHYSFLNKYLMKLTLQPELAEDLTQETMVKAYMQLSRFEGKSKFSTWLISIASRLYMDQKRKEHRDRKQMQQLMSESWRKLKWGMSVGGHEWSIYLELFAKLEPETKVPILLRHYYGFTYSEIASILHLKEGTVKTRVHYGLERIRKEWSQDEAK